MRTKVLSFALLVIGFMLTGCATGSVQTARTNGQGNFQFGVEPGVVGFAGGGGVGFVPSFNIAGRYGVSDRVDIGARIGSIGYEIQTKFAFTDPSDLEALAVALAPSFTAIGFGGTGGGFFLLASRIPLLFGIPVGDSELTVGPRISPAFFAGGAGGTNAGGFALSAGGEVGFAARLGDTFWLLPHAKVDVPVVAAAAGGGESGAVGGFGGVTFGAGVGLLFGGRGVSNPIPSSGGVGTDNTVQ